MIASLFGTVRALLLDRLVIEVNGVGYAVSITASTASQLSVGRDIQLFTSMVVREDSMTLYGFIEASEKELFELVQTVSGIGPKVALAISAAMNYEDLAIAITTKNESAIAAIPGIGKKSAQRMILELDGKMIPAHQVISSVAFSWRDQLIEALINLGFNRKQAESAVNDLGVNHQPAELSAMTASELLKLALSQTGAPASAKSAKSANSAKNLQSKKGNRK